MRQQAGEAQQRLRAQERQRRGTASSSTPRRRMPVSTLRWISGRAARGARRATSRAARGSTPRASAGGAHLVSCSRGSCRARGSGPPRRRGAARLPPPPARRPASPRRARSSARATASAVPVGVGLDHRQHAGGPRPAAHAGEVRTSASRSTSTHAGRSAPASSDLERGSDAELRPERGPAGRRPAPSGGPPPCSRGARLRKVVVSPKKASSTVPVSPLRSWRRSAPPARDSSVSGL